MARTMAVTAGVQIVTAALAAAMVPDVRGLLLGTAMFVPTWLLSAWLFARSAREAAWTGRRGATSPPRPPAGA